MKNLMTPAAVFVLGMFLSGVASAHSHSSDHVDKRQKTQRHRIVDGVRSGELNRGEAKELRKGQRRVRRMERRAESDGVVTKGEKRRIRRAQRRQSGKIYRKKHNNLKRD